MEKFISLHMCALTSKPNGNTPFIYATYEELVKLSGLPARGIYDGERMIAKYVSFVTESFPKEFVQLVSSEIVNPDKLCKWYIMISGNCSVADVTEPVRKFTKWLMTSLSRSEVVKTQDVSIDVKKLDEEINRLFAMTTFDCKTVNTLYDVVQPAAESFKKLQSLVEYHSLLKSAENVKNAALTSIVGYDEEPDEYVRKKV